MSCPKGQTGPMAGEVYWGTEMEPARRITFAARDQAGSGTGGPGNGRAGLGLGNRQSAGSSSKRIVCS